MAELADALVLGSSVHDVQVRFLLSAPIAAGAVSSAAFFYLPQKDGKTAKAGPVIRSFGFRAYRESVVTKPEKYASLIPAVPLAWVPSEPGEKTPERFVLFRL